MLEPLPPGKSEPDPLSEFDFLHFDAQICQSCPGSIFSPEVWTVVDLQQQSTNQLESRTSLFECHTTPDLMEKIVAEMDSSESEWVFTKDNGVTQIGSIRTAFKAAARRAGIPELRPHDLRHLFAKKLAEDPDVSAFDLMDLGGWKTPSMVKRYVGTMNDERRRNIIDRAAAKSSKVVRIDRKKKVA
jgi:integrase